MTETRKESLSALIDGEASEIEVHRLVREFRSDDGLAKSWSMYQHIRTTVRADSPGLSAALSPQHHEQLLSSISAAIEAEPVHAQPASQKQHAPLRLAAGSLAVAASLVIAVFVGFQPSESDTTEFADAGVGMTPALVSSPLSSPIVALPVANDSQAFAQAPDLVELDAEKQKRLRAYLNQHDRMARMNTNSQLVNFTQEASGK